MRIVVIILMFLSFFAQCSRVVRTVDQCTECHQMETQYNCEQFGGCSWRWELGPHCNPSWFMTHYCEIYHIQEKCSKTFGCASLDGKCVPFSGCSAYVRSTTTECQSISYQCVSDGTTCLQQLECGDYKTKCLELDKNQRKCKLDQGVCRNYTCDEADKSLNTNSQCDSFSDGCITTGAGCTKPPLKQCSAYRSTKEQCNKMRGSDGPCKSSVSSGVASCIKQPPYPCSQCNWKQLYDDDCIDDDIGLTKCNNSCQALRPENSDWGCDSQKKGCVTNGQRCTFARSLCSQYKVRKGEECNSLIGADGNCILEVKNIISDYETCVRLQAYAWHSYISGCYIYTCTAKKCEKYSVLYRNERTGKVEERNCREVQAWCANRSRYCQTSLIPCSEYQKNAKYLKCTDRLGVNGRCEDGSGFYCKTRQCSGAPTSYRTNEQCLNYSPGCITTGSGCKFKTSCENIFLDYDCWTTEEGSCAWQQKCIENTSCFSFKTEFQCSTKFTADYRRCIWKNSQCIEKPNEGLHYSTDQECLLYSNGKQITNGEICLDRNNCSLFYGFKGYCFGLNAFCTNDSHIYQSNCRDRRCSDKYHGNNDCQHYLQSCLPNGNGCIDNTEPCSSYVGTQEQCRQYSGYFNNKVQGIKCWNQNQGVGNCTERICEYALRPHSNQDCENFLSGCIYDGDQHCVNPESSCSLYFGDINTCLNFKDSNGAIPCFFDSSTNNKCRNRVCQDNTSARSDEECNSFLKGCLTKGIGCVDPNFSCDSQDACNVNPVKCIELITCRSKTCSDKSDAINNQSCINYSTKCRIMHNTTNCKDVELYCKDYVLVQTSENDKQVYCSSITTLSGSKCGYDPLTSTTQCNGLGITKCEEVISPSNIAVCDSLLGQGNCLWYNTKCYTFHQECSQYQLLEIPQGKQSDFCKNMKNIKGQKCKYDSMQSQNSCVDDATCAGISSPTSQLDCDVNVTFLQCKFYDLIPACYDIIPCTYYIFPAEITSNEDKLLFCQNMYHNIIGVYGFRQFCSFEENSTTCSNPQLCSQFTLPTSNQAEFCNVRRAAYSTMCQYSPQNPSNCVDDYDSISYCQKISISIQYQWECDIRATPGGCKVQNGSCVGKPQVDCSQIVASGSSDSENLNICKDNECQYKNESYCISAYNCSAFSGLDSSVDMIEYCSKRTNDSGKKCTSNGTECRNLLNCELYPSPNSQSDCDLFSQGYDVGLEQSGCIYYSGHCYPKFQGECPYYKALGSDDASRLAYCNTVFGYITSCTYLIGVEAPTCINKGECSSYSVTNYPGAITKGACESALSTAVNGCTYWNNNSNNCIAIGECSEYTGGNGDTIVADCASLKDKHGQYCQGILGNTFCSSANMQIVNTITNCADIQQPRSQADCDSFLSNCQYFQLKCYQSGSCTDYTFNGDYDLFCSSMRNKLTGELCTSVNNVIGCIERDCSQAKFTSHSECKSYKSTCKSDGMKCIEGTVKCSDQKRILSYCSAALDDDILSSCMVSTEEVCVIKTCDLNIVAQSDLECNSYLKGCVTKGVGCISSTAPCSSYYGTISSCKKFTGNGIKCWGDSQNSLKSCRNRECSDIPTIVKSEAECQEFLINCYHNGSGYCIDANLPCSSYYGTKDTCQTVKGINQTTLCAGLSSTKNACKIRECSDLAGTSDLDCQAFIPAAIGADPICVTDGKQCVNYPRNCSDFIGNWDSCLTFTAKDGPCQSPVQSGAQTKCIPKICSQAPPGYDEDQQCQSYHPSCVTNGHGCTLPQPGCDYLLTDQSCQAKKGCTWFELCSNQKFKTCESLTQEGQKYCLRNTLVDGRKCAWRDNACKNSTCADLQGTDYWSCNQQNSTCTTNGYFGCITIQTCKDYQVSTVCNAAHTTEGGRCTWDTISGKCRDYQQQCSDLSASRDYQCDFFMPGCKTNGLTCIGPKYNCSAFNGPKDYCLSDSTGYPCLYVNNVCYKFARCEDAKFSDFSICQAFSKQCVPSSLSCIPLGPCEKYEEQISCIIGVQNTTCGWLPSGKCQSFHYCSELGGTNNQDCQNYGTNCVTDGLKCVEKMKCNQTQWQDTCINFEGTDGLCTWESSQKKCRLRRCEDRLGITDSDCAIFAVTDQKCITDGTKCITKSSCFSYMSEAICKVDSDDNPCFFDQKGQYCRNWECTDVVGTTQEQCNVKVKGKECIFNGVQCFEKTKCKFTKTLTACGQGGTDGICYFIPDDKRYPSKGKCEKLRYCEQANNDEVACKSTPLCEWIPSPTITQCVTKACGEQPLGKCGSIPNVEGSEYRICMLKFNRCKPGDARELLINECYMESAKTYTYTYRSGCIPCRINMMNDTGAGLRIAFIFLLAIQLV